MVFFFNTMLCDPLFLSPSVLYWAVYKLGVFVLFSLTDFPQQVYWTCIWGPHLTPWIWLEGPFDCIQEAFWGLCGHDQMALLETSGDPPMEPTCRLNHLWISGSVEEGDPHAVSVGLRQLWTWLEVWRSYHGSHPWIPLSMGFICWGYPLPIDTKVHL